MTAKALRNKLPHNESLVWTRLMLAAQFKRYACSILFTTEVELDYETKHW